ncbi:MAG: DUF1467 family protein [Pacificimonas sp.]|jgi:predicted secreted protein|nr:DUF1467 family protein [Pacificimonas sp.]
MGWFSALAIYFLIWVLCVFVTLPFGIRTADEEGTAKVPGQADSAPVHPLLFKKMAWATVLAAIVFGLFYYATEAGIIDLRALELMR